MTNTLPFLDNFCFNIRFQTCLILNLLYILFLGVIKNSTVNFIEEKTSYIKDLYVDETDFLRKIRESAPHALKDMQVSPLQGSYLKFFAQIIDANNVVEIGTFVGYSAACIALGMNSGGSLVSIETNPQYANLAIQNLSSLNNKVEVILGDAIEVLPRLNNLQKFDMVFIDANKSQYLNYLNIIEDNIKKGGIIIADNTLLFDDLFQKEYQNKPRVEFMKKFNLKLSEKDLYTTIMLDYSSGFSVAIKNF